MVREDRYLVFKRADLNRLTPEDKAKLSEIEWQVRYGRACRAKSPLVCVVVEADWPEYEPTWAAIEKRMDETPNAEVSRAHD